MTMPKFKASFSDEITPREIKNKAIAYEAASESITLLKNDGLLPIKPCHIALFGNGAAKTVKGGTGSGEVNERHAIGIEEGLELAGFTITSKNWLEKCRADYDEKKAAFKSAGLPIGRSSEDMINIMANHFRIPAGPVITDEDVSDSSAKCCIYVVARQAGECADRSLKDNDFSFMDEEIAHIKKICDRYESVILVINVGGTFDLSPIDEFKNIAAIIYFCQQGMEGGRAFADIICGEVNPSGALTDSWVNSYFDVPFADGFADMDGNAKETDYREGIYVGYRYFETFGKPVRYPFGYGLSYTTFDFAQASCGVKNGQVFADIEMTNTGAVAGKAIVQLYVSCPDGELEKERLRLVGFSKTKHLDVGEKQLVTISFPLSYLTSYDEKKASYVIEAGNYVLYAAKNVKETFPIARLNISETVITEKCTNILPCDNAFTELSKEDIHDIKDGEFGDIPSIDVDLGQIETISHSYDYETSSPSNEKINSIIRRLSTEEKLTLLAGTGYFGSKPTCYVPGAAAYTAALPKHGIPSTALCDGPAGLRLQRVSALTKKGQIKPMEMMMDFMNDWPKIFKKIMCGNPKKDTLLYQNATAFPVGTALAMTWNQELVEKVGDAVGTEMEEFGCTFWLAPGMNIHRNPLCGRNYEYYSEDPVVSGKIAAAMSRGVQSHKGCYVTIKHFAANNQETNRAGMSSNVKERALREIYLKGFEIAVKEGGAKAVMTSYNKINHVWAPNSIDLCSRVLRDEWEFDGLVMTDWMSTDKGLANRSAAYRAGNDLIMPGGNAVVKECIKDYRSGNLKQDDIDRCVSNVLNLVVQ